MAGDRVFADLRQLAAWFATPASRPRSRGVLERLARRLGPTAIPLLGRELRHPDPARRDAARDALADLAATAARPRVIRALHDVIAGGTDEAKLCALGLLAQLGEPAAARFRDPTAIQRQSALALASQLATAADVASVADVMIRELDADEIAQMLDVLAPVAAEAARRLATELADRLDVPAGLRARLVAILEHAPPAAAPAAPARPPCDVRVAVLVDAAARIVVVVAQPEPGERAWRRWAVLIGATGGIDDCLHEDHATDDGDAAGLVATLCADGYRVASSDPDHARTIVGAAARRTAQAGGALGSAYYLGRDLLDLRDAHVVRATRDPAAGALGRAVEQLAAGDVPGARAALAPLLARDGEAGPSAAVAGVLAACLLAEGDLAAAIAPLERAIAGEPAWPLHHWNLATALYRLGDTRGSYHALRRFLATSAAPTALLADPDQPGRVACARRLIDELERAARLAGTSLARPRRRRRRATASPARGCSPA